MKVKPKLFALARPSAARPAAAAVDEGEARLVVQMPKAQHRRLKIAATERGVTVRQFVLELLEREGI